MPAGAKVFGIGLSKTGTTSLANALQILGYRTRDNMGVVRYAKGELSSVDLGVVESFDALTDTPIPSFYRELDVRFPGSKFILTVRDSDAWFKSCKKQFTQRFADVQTDAHKRLFIDLYGTDVFEQDGFQAGYERFVDGVRDYFKSRPYDLLVMDVAAGDGWQKLCAFLGNPVPDVPFPKANVTRIRWMGIDEIVAIARCAGMELLRRYDGKADSGFMPHPAGPSPLAGVKELLGRVMRTVRREHPVQGAVRAANRVIVDGLTKVNPQIPVLSRAGNIVPYDARKDWNHFWLVDPLDGEAAFANGDAEFSIDVALVEDGVPIYGVVYMPATDTVYYGAAGKGAYRREGKGEAVRLGAEGKARSTATAGAASSPDVPSEVSSRALALCAASCGERAATEATFAPSAEWQTAAAHAILLCAGMTVRDAQSGRAPRYNQKELGHGRISVASMELERT
jgi:3'-phosphoadenosine 5'-phosphosulfate (PAPS) 3'-phosphatase